MRAIINMDDQLKKNTLKLEISTADNEDLTSKLEVGNFAVSSLHFSVPGPGSGVGVGFCAVHIGFAVINFTPKNIFPPARIHVPRLTVYYGQQKLTGAH